MDHSDGVRLAVHRQLQPGEVRRWQRISDLANSNHRRRQAVGSSSIRRHHDAEGATALLTSQRRLAQRGQGCSS